MLKTLTRLKKYLRPYLLLIVLSVILAIPLALIRVGPAPVLRYFLDDLLVNQQTTKLLLFPFILIGLYSLNFFVRLGHYYFLRIVIIRVNENLKNKTFQHLLSLSADYFTAQSTGTLISRTSVDPQYIDSGLSCLNVMIREPITLICLMAYAFKLNWQLTLMSLCIVPALSWIFTTTGKHLKRYIRQITQISAQMYSILQESFTGIRVIKAFSLEKYMYQKFREKNDTFAKTLIKTSLMEEASHPLVELITALALSPIIYYGGQQVLLKQMTPGDLLGFFAAFALMMNPIRMMNDVNLKLNQATAALDRLDEIFQWQPTVIEAKRPQTLTTFQQRIEFQEVFFAYPDRPHHFVLKDISFSIQKGQVIAIVGSSGSGKTSLINLIPRIFDVTQGRILIDGQDIRQFSIESLRHQIGIVSQEVFLFNDTLAENIRCGHLCASFEDIQEAAKRAYIFDFIQQLPQGFNTVIGDRGQKLSGGEKQRLSIARAFLRQAPLLILDEATSSLDTQSEKAVQAALEDLMKDRTTLAIAHRLSTIQHAHCILVLQEGVLIEQGTHEFLIKKNGSYSRSYQAQR